jgi:hypothetical protein
MVTMAAKRKKRIEEQRLLHAEEGEQRARRDLRQGALLVDRYLRSFDITESHHIVVNAAPEATYKALRNVDFKAIRSPLVRLAFALRGTILHVEELRSGLLPRRAPERMTFESLEKLGAIKLADEPGKEIVIGSVARLFGPVAISAAAFAAFDCPGYIKGVASFSIRPYGEGRSLLSYETRARATDVATRRRLFRLYDLTAPLRKAVTTRVLAYLKAAAEARCSARIAQGGTNAPGTR